MVQSGGFLGRLLGKLLPKVIPAATSLVKSVVAPLGLSAGISAIDGLFQKNIFSGSGPNNKLNDIMKIIKISNAGLSDIIKIINVLAGHNILPKGITRNAKNEVKSQRGGSLPILLGGLASSLIGNVLSKGLFGSRMYRAGQRKGLPRAGEGIKKKSLMPAHPLANFEI